MAPLSKKSTGMLVFLDRYAGLCDGDPQRPEFMGGNLGALRRKLEYLAWLGIDCLWITPFFKGSAYHGYHITDFFSVDRHFGNKEDLLALITEAHSRGIKVIADFVPNHCSYLHSFFMEAQANPRSRYRDWFYFTRWPDRYLTFLGYSQLPKMNLNNPEAREHIIAAANYWLSFGFDGLRLDHAAGPDLAFWRRFTREVKEEHPDCALIGEVALFGVPFRHFRTLGIRHRALRLLLGSGSSNLYKDYIGILDGVLDFKAREFLKRSIESARTSEALALLAKRLHVHYSAFPPDFLLPAFLDNHDMDRFLFVCDQDKEKLRKASEILFSLNQPIVLYYGTESGMTQDRPIHSLRSYGDLLARQPMNWDSMDQELLHFFKDLIWKRRS